MPFQTTDYQLFNYSTCLCVSSARDFLNSGGGEIITMCNEFILMIRVERQRNRRNDKLFIQYTKWKKPEKCWWSAECVGSWRR